MSITDRLTRASWARNGWAGVRSGTQRMGQAANAALQQVGRPKRSAGAYHMAGKRLDWTASRGAGLQMSDYWMLTSLVVILFWAIDPLQWSLDQIVVIKHFPLVIFLPSLVLAVFGKLVISKYNNRPASIVKIVGRDLAPIIGFALFVLMGSLIAKFVKGIDASFLTMGFFAFFAPITMWMVLVSNNPRRLAHAILIVFFVMACLMSIVQLALFASVHVFHAREHLVLPVLAAFLLFRRSFLIAFLGLGFLVATTVGAAKLTAYLVTLLSIGYFILVRVVGIYRALKSALERLTFNMLIVLGTVTVIASIALAYTMTRSLLPSGNPAYRLHTYAQAFMKFKSSPVWGVGFTGPAVEEFTRFKVETNTQMLSTHSDPLDIMANGGILGLGLWLGGVGVLILRAIKLSMGRSRANISVAALRLLHAFSILAIAGLVVSMFNPILNMPNLAWGYWIALGTLAALIRIERDQWA